MKRALLKILLLISICSNIKAQKADQFNSWWYYSGKYKITQGINLQSLYSWSRHNFVKDWQQSKLKLGAGYILFKNASFDTGYEWVVLYPYGKHPVSKKRTEHRIYERLSLKNKIQHISLNYGVLLEQRFMQTITRHRLRVLLGAKMPIVYSKKGDIKLGISFFNHLFFDIDTYANGKHLRQNRIYGGFDIPIHNSLTVGIGYMNQYIIINDSRIENDHTLMVSLSHKLGF
ncbi:DUF2490 domain-containing protein [Aquimarina aquimarini]|uniref:DUF2490 domain-containing protein n=1 Tax=Aquimarina aquimarini TaxID=1191734 RepID=UPI000D551132|nr:DUF2490 domain-containing protein [Aquimarina aquimarini]